MDGGGVEEWAVGERLSTEAAKLRDKYITALRVCQGTLSLSLSLSIYIYILIYVYIYIYVYIETIIRNPKNLGLFGYR